MKKSLLFLLLSITLLFAANRCDDKLFSIKSTSGISIKEYIDNLAQECDYTIIIKDKFAKKRLYKRLQKISLHNVTLHDFLNLLLTENDLTYELNDNVLKIGYLITKTFHVDYVTSKRTGETVTDASVDVGNSLTGTAGSTTTTSTTRSSGSGDVNKITSKDEFDFWKDISTEIHGILNRPEDEYQAPDPIVNINAGLITVTATKKQIERVEKYIATIQNRLHNEVMIDVSILAVILNDQYTNGIDWSRFSLLVNGDYGADNTFTPGTNTKLLSYTREGSGTSTSNFNVQRTIGSYFDASVNLAGIINFLEKNGQVITLSNPKLMTLNNQPAIISIGDTINYNVPTSIVISQNGGLGTQSFTPSSVFIGILLNITPEITENGEIILRINPSISEPRDPKQLDQTTNENGIRQIAPDISEKKISSVVKVKDGSTLILGGLISNIKNFTINGVPVLRDIPVLGGLFRSKARNNKRFELVFIIKPRIIKESSTDNYSLKDLGYSIVDHAKK
ncbi:pilus (MSHA type) biogenesis protein MshL [Nitratiruptor sp. SB155-2]|uniref:pilus (MSHA type) biogenesis protein MshL n=1 Tax=Nitratiruptor sp. (strain SB155-2) TaxID=387092 RepID=UPI00015872B2|nr:pilus (MSHA type) biogenesis protein MshL [Nitratiruptor sp. SB155-2]BAF70116.1 general secretory pathway protein D [Nitratiruptor sp. SB155-2]